MFFICLHFFGTYDSGEVHPALYPYAVRKKQALFDKVACTVRTYDVCSGRGEGGTPKADVVREVA